ncbi:hypothetical protein BKP37_04900 [Anaerobacillus alkalilacustris]|uniref:Uncharacterized protein n=1 Tax=Anaerobacillus alkalilacustris TaxID=393763 RepID=A0A1S2LY26_9BACI|nr:SafA/ExsA family spore coat assembly protein [Anaerobacillus alkalilacustris]OIJ16577.1 hypothetical protein BKP37_04900 [Anaerobacillus alkalilacustris]
MKIHIVQQGDTLWKLAKKYNVDFEQLKAVNNHLSNPDVIMPGMKIKIPTAGVPVKKQVPKKEEPIAMKEQPKPKEVPVPKKEVKVPPPAPVPEVVKKPEPVIQQPIHPQPIQQPITQEQYLHNMNMNFNIYKPMVPPPPKVPAPPKMAEKEIPKVEKPKPMVPPPVPPKKEIPKSAPIKEPVIKAEPPKYPTPQQHCYPVTGIMPGCSYQVPPVVQQHQVFPHYPMMPLPAQYGYPQAPMGAPMPGMQMPTMPTYPQPHGSPYGVGPIQQQPWSYMPEDVDLDEQDIEDGSPTGMPTLPPYPGMQMPPMQMSNYWGQPTVHPQYGDVTMYQQPVSPVNAQMMPQPQWGYTPYPMYQPHSAQFNSQFQQQVRPEGEDDENKD